MGKASSFNDPFARRAPPAGSGAPDRFSTKGKPPAGGDAFADRPAKAADGDAFKTSAPKPAPPKSAPPKPAPPSARAFEPVPPPPKPAAPPPAPKPAPPPRPLLQVVAANEAPVPVEAVAVDELRRKEQKRKFAAGRSSSLVLVSAAGPMTATAVAEPAVATGGGQGELVMPAITKPEPKAKVRSGGGGGAGAGGNPPRERLFSQDDLIGVLFGAAILIFLMFYLFRGRADAPADNRLVNSQFATNEAVVAPPPAPLVDPFGDAPVNLKPTSPIPAPAEPEAAIAPAAPVASPPPAPDRTLRAWFCTAQSELTPASRAALEKELTDFAKSFEGKEVVVMGYADTRGATAYNSWLGGVRANVVADFLRTKGIKIAEKEGVGELSGLEDNQNCANQRRVDVWVKGAPGEEPDRTCAPPREAAELVCG